MKSVYLLTGRPGSDKTSLIKQALAGMEIRAGGFNTEEIRRADTRQDFRLVTLANFKQTLADLKTG
jgi:nucleoside-triphosphatase THEP1